MNKVLLIGRLGKDPELSQTTTGIYVCKFSLAVNRRYQSADGTTEADWFNIVVWRAQGESCHKYLKKGSKAAVSGTIQNRSYEDREGNKRTVTEIIADEVEFLDPKEKTEQTASEPPKKRKTVDELEPYNDSDSLPF